MPGETYPETAVERFLPRIPATLYEVAWQYSLLDWYSAVDSGEIDWDLAPEHLSYLTPRAKSELFGETDSLIVVYVDLSDPDAPQLRPRREGGPLEITTYTASDRFRIGHAYPANKTSSMTDYSITTHKGADAHHIAGLRDDAWGTNNVQDRFTGWAQSDHATAVSERASSADKEILDGLAALGDDDAEMERLSEAFLEAAGGEDVEFDALITVCVCPPGRDEYRYPGEISVLNEVMVEKKSARLESISVEGASGEGIGYVTNDATTVTGGSPGLFGMYGKKQREHFPDLDTTGESAWRTRPLDFDMAAAIAAADSIFEDFYRGLRNNRRLYVLPYLVTRGTELAPADFVWFHQNVFQPLRDAESGSEGTFDDRLEQLMRDATEEGSDTDSSDAPFGDVESAGAWEAVRFAAVLQVTGNPDRVYFDTLDASHYPAALEDAHNQVTASSVFTGGGIFANNPPPDSSPLLGLSLELTQSILYGYYFERTTEPTRTSRQASERPGAGDIDDDRMQRVRKLITGSRIALQPLLEQYVHQLVQDQRDQFDGDNEFIDFPKRSVVEQYTQLRALTAADVLHTADTSFTFDVATMSDSAITRDERLESFLDTHQALDEDHNRAVFLLGGLVGRITAYQDYNNVSSTLVRRYPVDYLTKQTIKEVTKEVLQVDNSYAEADDDRSYLTNNRYTSRLADTMLATDPSGWSMTEAELQWLYSLGISYGLNDISIDQDTGSDSATETTEADD
jgi:hypothetical protein